MRVETVMGSRGSLITRCATSTDFAVLRWTRRRAPQQAQSGAQSLDIVIHPARVENQGGSLELVQSDGLLAKSIHFAWCDAWNALSLTPRAHRLHVSSGDLDKCTNFRLSLTPARKIQKQPRFGRQVLCEYGLQLVLGKF